MKAIQMTDYGDSSVLTLTEIEKPTISNDEVLIKISATTVNPMDMKIRSGAMKEMMPVEMPFIPGLDLSGTVEAVGKNVKRLQVGTKVFVNTQGGGAYAEYIGMKEDKVATIPDNVSMEEAAALAVPLNTSYNVLVEAAQVQPGQTILVHGAAGGVGNILIQMAKALGVKVIGTASGDGLDLIKSLGVDKAIDYKNQDFTEEVSEVDVVIDLVGGETQSKSYALVKKGGKLLSIVTPVSEEQAKKNGITAQFVIAASGLEKLNYGKRMVEENKIKPRVVAVYKLEEAAKAQDSVSKGGVHGKVVLKIE